MRLLRRSPGWLACLALFTASAAARAETPPDPLRLVPAQADFFFKLEQPRKLLDALAGIEVLKEFGRLDAIREAYDSTNARRFGQLVAYFEKQLGMKWPDLLDRLAGHGAAVAVRFASPAPVLLVVQGKDDKLMQKFFRLGLEVLDQELARQEAKERPERASYHGVETVRIGKQVYAAAAGPALLVSNHPKALEAAIDLYRGEAKDCVAALPGVAEARRTLPAEPLAWAWLNLETIRQFPQAKPLLAEKQNDVNLAVTVGGLLDLARRSPFICAGVYCRGESLLTTIRFPRGRDGMPKKAAVWVPPRGTPGSLPLLKPRNVVLSQSTYLDFSKYWELRDELFNKKQVATFEKFDKNSGRFLAGTRLSQLLTTAGPHYRFVLVQQTDPGYQTRPAQLFPAGAFVIEMRDPDKFSRAMDTVLRGVALLAGTQANLKLVEEKKGNSTIVGYRFPEEAKPAGRLRNDAGGVRFNFSPCFVRAGDQFVISSTIELARELVDLLTEEAKGAKKGSPDTGRTQIYGTGGAAVLRAFHDQLLTQTVLGRAVSPQEADKEVQSLIDLVARLGVLEFTQRYTAGQYHYDVRWKWGK